MTQGELKVNGSLAGISNLALSAGTTLSGAGTVGPTTLGTGVTLALGNSVGTLTISGPLVLGAGDTVEIDFNPFAVDLIIVNGTATLTEASVLAIPESGFYEAPCVEVS